MPAVLVAGHAAGVAASIGRVLGWLQASALSHFIAKANHLLIAGLQVVHVIGLILLLAPLLLIALRVLELVLPEQPFDDIIGQSRILSLVGLVLGLTSGAFMFLSAPLHYHANWAFDAKMVVLLAAAAVYGLIFAWSPGAIRSHGRLARFHVVVSLALWIAVCMAGRAIGFV